MSSLPAAAHRMRWSRWPIPSPRCAWSSMRSRPASWRRRASNSEHPHAMAMSPFPLLLAVGAGALLLDLLLGEPRRAHPLVGFGRWAQRLAAHLYRDDRLAGAVAWALAVLPWVALAALVQGWLWRWHPRWHAMTWPPRAWRWGASSAVTRRRWMRGK